MHLKTYSIWLVILLTLCFGVVSSINAVVDPYRLFNTPDITGINKYRYKFFFHQFLSKPHAVRQRRADAIILGVSRAGSGFSTDHPGWKDFNTYNFAVAGSSAYLQWRNYQHAKANGNLKRLLITLDFYSYNAFRQFLDLPEYREYEERLTVTPLNRTNLRFPERWFKDYSVSLLSFDTLRDSWDTYQAQAGIESGESSRATLTSSGFWIVDLPPSMSVRYIFRTIENQYMSEMWFPLPAKKFALVDENNVSSLIYLERILSDCYQEGIDVTLVFTPFHARLAESLRAVDLWDLFELWKREVILLNEKVAAKSGQPSFPIWDFTGYNSVTTEALPADDVKARMRWHIDASHISKEAGDLVQNLIWDTGGERVSDFGRKVNSGNIDQYIEDTRVAREKYAEMFPDDVADVTKSSRKAAAWRKIYL